MCGLRTRARMASGGGWKRRAPPAVWAGASLACALALEVLSVLLRGPRAGSGQEREPPAGGWWALASLLFLLGNALGNAHRFVTASPSTRGVMLLEGAGQGWDYCYSCQTHVPPRCSHCFACNVCVLRRDHHCTLLGQCLGYQNYRYFLCLLLHGAVALLYACLLNAGVLLSLMEGSPGEAALLLALPWLMLLMGQVNLRAFIYALITDLCAVGFLFCTGFLLFHCMLAVRGQTTKEWFESDRSYDLGWRWNLRELLGIRWPWVWLSPFIASPLPGDGITFQTKGPASELFLKARDL